MYNELLIKCFLQKFIIWFVSSSEQYYASFNASEFEFKIKSMNLWDLGNYSGCRVTGTVIFPIWFLVLLPPSFWEFRIGYTKAVFTIFKKISLLCHYLFIVDRTERPSLTLSLPSHIISHCLVRIPSYSI